uniref:3-phenylpropionate dioxygenase n=1 Tax=OCS116 cluster bacterium TaxID=2030921 RepID=A0A2A4Z6I4_9PROT
MNQVIETKPIERTDSYFRLRMEIEEFFFDEAEHIDNRRFADWLDMLHEDLRYFMPIRFNVKFGQHGDRENSREDEGISWFNEDKWTVQKRVEQILTGVHYAEEPLSRTSHIISNVQIQEVAPDSNNPNLVKTSCRFIVYQNRVETETYFFVGKRYDTLTKVEGVWKVLRREIIIDQNVMTAKNMCTFF